MEVLRKSLRQPYHLVRKLPCIQSTGTSHSQSINLSLSLSCPPKHPGLIQGNPTLRACDPTYSIHEPTSILSERITTHPYPLPNKQTNLPRQFSPFTGQSTAHHIYSTTAQQHGVHDPTTPATCLPACLPATARYIRLTGKQGGIGSMG